MAKSLLVLPSMDMGEVNEWMLQNTKRGLPACPYQTKNGAISVCGNGPSLRDNFPKDGPIAALNGAWKSLAKNGVTPDYIIAFDPSPNNVEWFKDAPDVDYFIASDMHPSVYEALKGKRVYQWHLNGEAQREARLGPLIGGGFSIGCLSLNLLHCIGFTHFDIYGMDSCYGFDGSHHASAQNWAITPPKVYSVGNVSFLAEPWMAAQVEHFLEQVEANRRNYTVDVKCDGFLAAALDHNTLKVVYDLDVAPGSFDFMCSMLNIENYRVECGYSRVKVNLKPGSKDGFRPVDVIDIGHEQKNQMLNHVVRPLLRMFAMEECGPIEKPNALIGAIEGTVEGIVRFPYSPRPSVEHYRETGNLARYEASAEAAAWAATEFPDRPYVITLREAAYWPQRNSNVDAWIRFAETLDRRVIFLRDTARAHDKITAFETCPEASIDLHKRLALYRQAEMNFFVTNGPAGLAHYSADIPYLNFFKEAPGYHCYDPEWLKDYIGLEPYGQLPWASPRQRMIYADDTLENITQAFNEMRNVPQSA